MGDPMTSKSAYGFEIDRRALLFGIATAAISLASCDQKTTKSSSPSLLQQLLSKKTVNIGYTVLAPWATKDANTGSISGWYVDLARAIFTPIHIDINFIETTWATFVAGIQTGRYDLSIVPSYPTIQRALAVAFTNPISELANSALVRTSAPFHSVFELNKPNIKLVAIEGEQSAEFIRSNLPTAKLQTFSNGDFALLYTEVLTGRADAAFGYADSIADFVAHHDGVRDISPDAPYSVLPICWGTSYQGSDFREFLNSSLAYLKGNGTVKALQLKYKT